MEALPLVTVVIANHNYSTWVGDSLRSVCDSDYPNKAIAIVDDGSTDNSWEVINLNCNLRPANDAISPIYVGKCGGVPVYAYKLTQAGGPSRARNIAIKMTWEFTQLFQILDSDDMLLPTKLSKCVAWFMEDPEHIGGVYSNYTILNPDNGNKVDEFKEPYSRERLMQDCIVHSQCMISKLALNSIIENGQFYLDSLRTCEDYDAFLRISDKYMFIHIPEILSIVRSGSHDSTNTVTKQLWEQNYRIVKERMLARMNQQ